ncbi:hypothetical protein CA85_04200 [Allorhodopirellula solitaria]|uniref:Uncharacterized protein n=1 Tax=Allorhodopirellula solitaria TaxID=2527987 RepID=A0A5C5YJR2_9BACT|nr:hypothetical protein CA85_04200 [Allorhodopirellula solitaria]
MRQRGNSSVLRGEQVILADASGFQDRFAVEGRWHWPYGTRLTTTANAVHPMRFKLIRIGRGDGSEG